MNRNIVEFGMEGVVVAILSGSPGSYAVGEKIEVPGAVSLTEDVSENEAKFYADNRLYFARKNASSRTGELQMAKFPDAFKEKILGFLKLKNGGVAEADNAVGKPMIIGFIGEGDAHQVKRLIYNAVPGKIKRSHKTIADGVEVEVESLPITIVGIPTTDKDGKKWNITKAAISPDEAGYATALSTIALPELPTE